jgi:hypothetical protein
MELYNVMRTTFAVREFTDDPLPDPSLTRFGGQILNRARPIEEFTTRDRFDGPPFQHQA